MENKLALLETIKIKVETSSLMTQTNDVDEIQNKWIEMEDRMNLFLR